MMASYNALRRAVYKRSKMKVGDTRKLHNWTLHRVENRYDARPFYMLKHYTTNMAEWCDNEDGTSEIGYTSLGWGSVSDQGGMNALFDTLNVGLRYSRAGGADISTVDKYPDTYVNYMKERYATR